MDWDNLGQPCLLVRPLTNRGFKITEDPILKHKSLLAAGEKKCSYNFLHWGGGILKIDWGLASKMRWGHGPSGPPLTTPLI